MAAFSKFHQFAGDVGAAKHDLGAHTLKIMLTNTAPVAGNSVKADLTEIAAGFGYAAGGSAIGGTAYSQTAGVGKLTGSDVTFAASGGDVGPFRYAVIYNDTQTSPVKPLVGWYDYGANVTLADGETFAINFGATILTIT